MSRNSQGSATSSARLTRIFTLLALTLALLWLAAFLAIGYPWTVVGSSPDALSYLWMADTLNHGLSSPQSAFGAHLLFHGRLPPGYALYLSAFGAGVDPTGMRSANLAQMMAVLGMILLVAAYAWRRTGSMFAMWLVVLYTLAHPMLTPWSFELFSEPLYAGLLIAICMIASHDRIPRAWFWAALLTGLAALVRSMGLLLIPALALSLVQRSRRLALLAAVLASAPTVIWSMLKGPSGEGTGGSYLAQLQSQLVAADGHWLDLAFTQANSLIRSLAPGGLPEALRLLVGALLLALFLRVAWQQRHKPGFPTLAVLATLAILAIWPFPGYLDRLSGPVVPLMLIGVIQAWPPRLIGRLSTAFQDYSPWWVGVGALLVLSAMTANLLSLARPSLWNVNAEVRPFMRNASALMAADPAFIAKVHLSSSLAASKLVLQLPAGECVSSTFVYWVRLFSKVPVADTAVPFSWDQNPCSYVLLVNLAAPRDHFNGLYPMPLPKEQYAIVSVSREAPGLPMLSAVIKRRH